jgi:hypothetical protein
MSHLPGLLGVAFGWLLLRHAAAVAGVYAGVIRSMGPRRLAHYYESREGLWTVRLAGLAFVGFGIYWTVVGT